MKNEKEISSHEFVKELSQRGIKIYSNGKEYWFNPSLTNCEMPEEIREGYSEVKFDT